MKNKRLVMYIGIVILVLIIIGIGYLVYINIGNEDEGTLTEYTPEEEITDEQLRETVVTLYFMEIETGNLVPEPRKIDAKELMENPYSFLVKLLINGPENEEMTKVLPPDTVLNKAEIIGNTVHLDFAENFVKDQKLGEAQEKLIINSIVNTLTELTEVNAVKITIDGKENMGYPDEGVMFKEPFTRQN